MESFSGLDWDAGNRGKCQTHGVSIAEIESMFAGQPNYAPDVAHSIGEQRYLATGRTTAGRLLFVVFTIRGRGSARYVRPISARYMHAKEAARYGHT